MVLQAGYNPVELILIGPNKELAFHPGWPYIRYGLISGGLTSGIYCKRFGHAPKSTQQPWSGNLTPLSQRGESSPFQPCETDRPSGTTSKKLDRTIHSEGLLLRGVAVVPPFFPCGAPGKSHNSSITFHHFCQTLTTIPLTLYEI